MRYPPDLIQKVLLKFYREDSIPLPQCQAKCPKGQKILGIHKANLITGQLDMKGPGIEKSLEQAIILNTRKGLKKIIMRKEAQISPTEQMELKVRFITLTMNQERVIDILQ